MEEGKQKDDHSRLDSESHVLTRSFQPKNSHKIEHNKKKVIINTINFQKLFDSITANHSGTYLNLVYAKKININESSHKVQPKAESRWVHVKRFNIDSVK